jgi:hypothetical protein
VDSLWQDLRLRCGCYAGTWCSRESRIGKRIKNGHHSSNRPLVVRRTAGTHAVGRPEILTQAVERGIHAADAEMAVLRHPDDGRNRRGVGGAAQGHDGVAFWVLRPGGALAGVGIYGVLAYSVAQRAHEIGIRISVGAQAVGVIGRIGAGAARLAQAGVGEGALAALGLARLASGLRRAGLDPGDPHRSAECDAGPMAPPAKAVIAKKRIRYNRKFRELYPKVK